MAKIYSPGRTIGGNGIAENSLSVSVGDLLTIDGGFVTKAGVGSAIKGIATSVQSFDADNQTVMQKKLEFKSFDDYSIIEIETTADLAQANVDSLFDLDVNGVVDVATAGTGTSLRLKQIKTDRVGLFQIAK